MASIEIMGCDRNNVQVLQTLGDVTEIVKDVSRNQGMWQKTGKPRLLRESGDITEIIKEFYRNQGKWQK